MLVCPSCRSENLEDAEVCRHCGNSLDAVSAPLRRAERSEEEEPQIDLQPARRRSAWPLVITILVFGLGLLGWGMYAALQPNPCAGKFSSSLFSYCADIPAGWTGGLRPIGETYEDRFEPVADSGQAQATVSVAQVLDPTVGTPQYVQQFRTSQEANGHVLGEIEPVMLDGEQALSWGYTVAPDTGEDPLRVREVLLVRADGAWRIQLIATDQIYEQARFAFEEMLLSWRWKP